MLRSLLGRLLPGGNESERTPDEGAGAGADAGDDADSEATEDGEGGFLRSRLDASVLYSHGMGDRKVEVDEPTVSDEEAEVLEEYHDER